MAGEKVRRILLARDAPFTAAELKALSDAEGWRWIYAHPAQGRARRTRVCFTGFGAARKRELAALAERLGFEVTVTVAKDLAILCTGSEPGPAKLERARQVGAEVLTEREFLEAYGPD